MKVNSELQFELKVDDGTLIQKLSKLSESINRLYGALAEVQTELRTFQSCYYEVTDTVMTFSLKGTETKVTKIDKFKKWFNRIKKVRL